MARRKPTVELHTVTQLPEGDLPPYVVTIRYAGRTTFVYVGEDGVRVGERGQWSAPRDPTGAAAKY